MNKQQSSVRKITAAQFAHEIGDSDIPVMLTFTSGGCSSCGKMLGTLETMAKVYDNRIKFLQIDTVDAGELMLQYRRNGTPLSLMFYKGKVLKSPVLQTQEPNFPNEAVWLGNAVYIQYFVQFLDSIVHIVSTNQVSK